MQVLLRQVKLETKLLFRDKGALFWTLAFPVFMVVLFGLIYQEQGETWDGMAPINYILPGIIVMAVMTTCVITTTTGFVEEREKGIYRRLSVTPLKRQTLIGGQIVNRYLVVLLQTVILIAIGIAFLGATIGGNYLLFWAVLTIGVLSFLSLGFAIAGFVKSAKGALPLSMALFFILLFLGGVFFPLEVMPEFLHPFSRALPSTNLNDALRMVAIEGEGIGAVWQELAILGGWLVVCSALAVKFFKWE